MHALAIILTAATLGQTERVVPEDPSALRLERVEQGFEDVSPLARSLLRAAPEFRAPSGYDAVYRVPGSDGLLMRQNGAVRALFDRSEYRQTRFGAEAMVPAGTIYSIGEPSDELLATLSGRVGRSLVRPMGGEPAHRSDRRVSNRIAPGADRLDEPRRLEAPVSVNIWTSEAVRRSRVGSLLGSLREDSRPSEPGADE
jgi:hypothetical protein